MHKGGAGLRRPRPASVPGLPIGRILDAVHRLEFTIEPFAEGHPGPHVTGPTEALRALGYEVEFGPFGSTAIVPDDELGAAVALVAATAFEQGATHLNLDVHKLDAGPDEARLSG